MEEHRAHFRLLLAALLMASIIMPLALTFTSFPAQSLFLPPTANAQPPATVKEFNPPWWNYAFRYRIQVNLTDVSGVEHVDQPVDVYLTFDNGTCYNNSLRVRYYDGTWQMVPCQVWNETYWEGTSYYKSLTLTFYFNVGANSTRTYYVYYNDADSGVEAYTNDVWWSFNGTHYTFESSTYRANCSIAAGGGKIEDCYNKISGTYWTSRTINDPLGNWGFHWNPDYDYSTGTTSKYPPQAYQVVESGPLFIIYTTRAKLGDYDAYCNITYRFFKWGWMCETNSTFNSPASGKDYRNNEWVFNPAIMRNLTYKYQSGVTTITFGEGNQQVNLQNYTYNPLLWFCLWDQIDGEAAGTFDLAAPIVNGAIVRQGYWYYRVFWRGTSYYEFWDRYWGVVDFNAGGWIYEKFAVYIWDGRNGYSPFQSFAEGMKAQLSVSVGQPEDVFYRLEVTVTDPTGHPIPNANVSVYNDESYSELNASKLTDENGKCTFLLYYRDKYYLQAELELGYLPAGDRYINQTGEWVPGSSPSEVTIILNCTRLYLEVYDKLGARVQNANVSIRYTAGGPGNITDQSVDQYYANISLYVKAGAQFFVNVSTTANPDESIRLFNMSDGQEISQPLSISGPASIRVELERSLDMRQTVLVCINGGFISVNWSDKAFLSVWLNWTPPNVGVDADWVNFSISHINGTLVYGPVTMNKNGSTVGHWYYELNTSDAGMIGGYTYLLTFYGKPSNPSLYAYPTPLTVYLQVKELPLTVIYEPFINTTWSSPPSFSVSVYLNDTTRNLPVTGATVSYSFLNTPYSGNMANLGNGTYAIPSDVLKELASGSYIIEVVPLAQNYTAQLIRIALVINSIPTNMKLSSESLQGGQLTVIYNRTLTLSVEFKDGGGSPITNAIVTWSISGTDYSGAMTETQGGVYKATLDLSELSLPPGTYVMSIIALKPNHQVQSVVVPLSVSPIPSTLTLQVFPLSSKFLVGQYSLVENNVPFVPLLFTVKDDLGNPVTGANVTLLGLPVWEVSPGLYFTLIPVYGLPDATLPLTIQAQKENYQPASAVTLVNVKEWTVPLVGLPYKVFLALLAGVLVPSSAFASYVYLQRARIPPLVRRIDYLIERISRGLPVEVGKPKARGDVILGILRDELSVVGVEPMPVAFVPPEVADKLVPLLVEAGKSESEAQVILAELRSTSPAEREKLLESIGVPPDLSAAILRELEKEEERGEERKKPRRRAKKKAGEAEEEQAIKPGEGGGGVEVEGKDEEGTKGEES